MHCNLIPYLFVLFLVKLACLIIYNKKKMKNATASHFWEV